MERGQDKGKLVSKSSNRIQSTSTPLVTEWPGGWGWGWGLPRWVVSLGVAVKNLTEGTTGLSRRLLKAIIIKSNFITVQPGSESLDSRWLAPVYKISVRSCYKQLMVELTSRSGNNLTPLKRIFNRD